MKGNSFKELLQMLRNQDLLRADGFRPIGWYQGKMVWKKNATEKESSATKILVLDSEKVLPIDDINAILIA